MPLVPGCDGHTIAATHRPPCQDIVAQLRVTFPKPVSDRMHDAYFVFSFLDRGAEVVHPQPVLRGHARRRRPRFDLAGARRRRRGVARGM